MCKRGIPLLLAVVGNGPAQEPLDGSWGVSDVVRIAKQQEQVVRFVRGAGFRTARLVRPGGGEAHAGEEVVEFVRELDVAGLIRVDFSHRTIVHADGRQVGRTVQSVGFDGKVAWDWEKERQWVHEAGHPVIPVNSATISYERRASILNEAASGFIYTLPGLFWNTLSRCSDMLSDGDWRVVEDSNAGGVWIERRDGQSTVERWLLKKSWDYCVARYEMRLDGASTCSREWTVLESEMLVSGFWYPRKVHFEIEQQSPPGRRIGDVEVSDLEVLDTVDSRVFEARFPNGTRVTDSATGKAVVVAAADPEVDGLISNQADKFRGLVKFEPARRSWVWQLSGAAMAIAGVWILLRWKRSGGADGGKRRDESGLRRQRRADRARQRAGGILLPLITSLFVAAGASAQVPWMTRILDQQPVSNCAVHAVSLVGAFFERSCSTGECAAMLGCSETRYEEVSLEVMQQALCGIGLAAEGFRDASIGSLAAATRSRSCLAILHVRLDSGIGHYYVLGPGRDGVVVANPLRGTEEHAIDSAFVSRLQAASSGVGLLVSNPGPTAAPSFHLGDRASYVFRRIGLAAGTHTWSVEVVNDGNEEVSLASAESTCGCFESAVLTPSHLAPNAHGVLEFVVDSSKVGESAKRQDVLLKFDRPNGAHWPCHLLLEVARRHVEDSVKAAVYPASVRPESTLNDHHVARFSVLIPNGAIVEDWRGEDGVELALLSASAADGGVAFEYQVRWPATKPLTNEWLQLRVRDAEGARQVVVCRLLTGRRA